MAVEMLRPVDYNIAYGVYPDMTEHGWAQDDWPKIYAKGEAARDFTIQCADEHGVIGLVNLYGIESPGFTSAITIGEHVARLIAAQP